jgi:anti-sigma factor RsiW
MKDSEFIELLNLYLDHEISASDAARLETEVLNNPARRTVYQDYCRMQKACKLLAQDFVEESTPAPRNVVAFEGGRRSSRVGWIATGTFAAAAACLAVVLTVKREAPVTAPNAVVREESVKIPTEKLATNSSERSLPSSVTVPAPAHDEGHFVPVTALALGTNGNTTPERFVSSADPTAPQFAWMNTVQLAPVQRASLDEFRATARPNSPAPIRAKNGNQAPTEWIVIRWQKR